MSQTLSSLGHMCPREHPPRLPRLKRGHDLGQTQAKDFHNRKHPPQPSLLHQSPSVTTGAVSTNPSCSPCGSHEREVSGSKPTKTCGSTQSLRSVGWKPPALVGLPSSRPLLPSPDRAFWLAHHLLGSSTAWPPQRPHLQGKRYDFPRVLSTNPYPGPPS